MIKYELMKQLILFIALFLLVGCTSKNATVTITTIGAKDSLLFVRKPINRFPLEVTDTLIIKDGSKHTIQIPVNALSSMSLRNGRNYKTLLLEPSGNYEVIFDYTQNPVVSVNDSAQSVYNRVFADKNIYKYEFVNNFTEYPLDTVASRMLSNFEELIAKDKAQFKYVEMSTDKRTFIEKNIELYWITSLSKVLRANYFNTLRESKPMYEGYCDLWGTIYEKYPVSNKLIPSEWLLPYTEVQINFQKMSFKDVNKPKSIEEALQNKYNDIYTFVKDKEILQTILSQALFSDCLNNGTYNMAILSHIEKYSDEYPGNPYLKSFEPFVAEVKTFNQLIKGDFSANVHFVEGCDSITTFSEVLNRFKGKPLFIDFWFTTCSPCREQFKYAEPLKTFLKEKGVEMLYISIDRKEIDWHNSIKYFNLEGNHVRANQLLHDDLYKKYKIGLFPHFMIVDANGEIAVHRAKQPSEGEALYKQIGEALSK